MEKIAPKSLLPFICMIFSISVSYRFMEIFSPNNKGFLGMLELVCVPIIYFAFYSIQTKKKNNIIMGDIVLSVILIVIFILISLEGHGFYDSILSYVTWFKNRDRESIVSYFVCTTLIVAMVITALAYYFTIIRLRFLVLFLIGVSIFMFGGLFGFDEISISLYGFLFVIALSYIERTRTKTGKVSNASDNLKLGYLISILLAIGIFIGITLLIPKPVAIPRISYIDNSISKLLGELNIEYSQQMLDGNRNSSELDPLNLRLRSQLEGSRGPIKDKLLFEVEADEPVYLGIQSWDVYKTNEWVAGDKYWVWDDENYYFETQQRLLFYKTLAEIGKKSELESAFGSNYKKIKASSSSYQKEKTIHIKLTNISARFLPHPIGMTGIYGNSNIEREQLTMDFYSSCFLKNKVSLKKGSEYYISYKPLHLIPGTKEYQVIKYAKNGFINKAVKSDLYYVCKKAINKFRTYDTERGYMGSFITDYKYAHSLYTKLPNNIPPRIYKLAKQIVKGKKTDLDKALAIESYFSKSGFEYTLSPPSAPAGRDIIDYFLFESKKGYCTHFASAMVILARASGIPARYVEGFMVSKSKNKNKNVYEVHSTDAHAYPEIFLEGAGWVVFEPTVATGTGVDSNQKAGFGTTQLKNVRNFFSNLNKYSINVIKNIKLVYNNWSLQMRILSIIISVILLLSLMLLFVQFRYVYRRKCVYRLENNERIQVLLVDIQSMLKKVRMDKEKYETPSKYAIRIGTSSELDIIRAVEIFNEAEYGGKKVLKEDLNIVYETYNRVVEYVKKKKGCVWYFLHVHFSRLI